MIKYNVIVVGGGLSGVAAAVAAAREKQKVLLLEKNNHLGGAASNCLINPFMKFSIKGKNGLERINNGIFGYLVDEMHRMNGLDESLSPDIVFNNEYMKYLLERLCLESGVDVLFSATVTGAKTENGIIEHISVFAGNNFTEYAADCFVDCSGDADLAYFSGVPCRVGRDGDNLCQPMTLCFWLSGVDTDKFEKERASINPLYKKFREEGKIKNVRENVLIFKHVAKGILHFNTTRVVGLNPTDPADVTKAQFIARGQVFEMYAFLKENFECFRNSVLLLTAPEIGIRESRMIIGKYVWTKEDVLSYRKFDDAVACGCYEIDIHSPDGTGTQLIYLDRTKYYTIPYRSLLPENVDNLLVAGRCISATHEAQSAYRIMPIICNIGESAGYAAAIAAKKKINCSEVDKDELHSLLDKYGVKYK